MVPWNWHPTKIQKVRLAIDELTLSFYSKNVKITSGNVQFEELRQLKPWLGWKNENKNN